MDARRHRCARDSDELTVASPSTEGAPTMPDTACLSRSRSSPRPSRGDRLMLALLRSPARRVLGGMVLELRYTGRRTGREYTLPVEYARTADGVVVRPQHPDGTAWWRNFRTAAPVTVR